MVYDILVRSHSGLRWIVLLLLVLVIVKGLSAFQGRQAPTPADKRLSLFTLISVHLQVLIGLALYFISPRVHFSANTMGNDMLRFFTVEHALGMLVAVILATIAHRRAKSDSLKGMFWYYTIALLIIVISIPWPFRGFGTGLF